MRIRKSDTDGFDDEFKEELEDEEIRMSSSTDSF